jgi:hypothetical protein
MWPTRDATPVSASLTTDAAIHASRAWPLTTATPCVRERKTSPKPVPKSTPRVAPSMGRTGFGLSRPLSWPLRPLGFTESLPTKEVLRRSILGNKNPRICGDFISPLTDSNRRPPPYHADPAATGRNLRQRFLPDSGPSATGPFATGCHWLRPLGSMNAPSSGDACACPATRCSTEVVHTPARVNVTCVTPLGEETASTS